MQWDHPTLCCLRREDALLSSEENGNRRKEKGNDRGTRIGLVDAVLSVCLKAAPAWQVPRESFSESPEYTGLPVMASCVFLLVPITK